MKRSEDLETSLMITTTYLSNFSAPTPISGSNADTFPSGLVSLPGGRTAIVWTENINAGIWLTLIDAGGVSEGPAIRVSEPGQDVNRPAITLLENGNLLVAFTDLSDTTRAVTATQAFGPDGTRIGPQREIYGDPDHTVVNPEVLALPDGGYVTMQDNLGGDGSAFGVYGQIVSADGNLRGPPFLVNETTDSFQSEAQMAILDDGGFAVTWRSRSVDGSFAAVMLRTYDPDGTPRHGERQVNTFFLDSQQDPSIAKLADGRLIITWNSDGQDGSGDGIYARFFTASGLPDGPEFRINERTLNDQNNPTVAARPDGGFAIIWQNMLADDQTDLRLRQFDSNGEAISAEEILAEGPLKLSVFPKLQIAEDGSAYAGWLNLTQGSGEGTTYFTSSGIRVTGTEDNDVLSGSAAGDVLSGLAGDDTLNGGNGKDTLIGGESNDYLVGGLSETDLRDIVYGGAGHDSIDGGAGNDELWGQDGNDTIEGGFGVDTILGGAGD
ncbi:MAG: calcium-binding protein, partial [Paracoccaceae bacterium]